MVNGKGGAVNGEREVVGTVFHVLFKGMKRDEGDEKG
jgi:hypothetical protein